MTLESRNQQRINQAKVDYADNLLRDAERRNLIPPASFANGVNPVTGKIRLQTLGRGETEVEAITNGGIGRGDRVTVRGGLADSMPTSNAKPNNPAPPEKLGKIKSLLSTVSEGRITLYIGSDRPKPKKIATLPEGATIEGAWIHNYGKGDRYLVAVQYRVNGDRTFQTFGSQNWELSSQGQDLSESERDAINLAQFSYFGGGFWTSNVSPVRSQGDYFTTTSTPIPPVNVTSENQDGLILVREIQNGTHGSLYSEVKPEFRYRVSGGGSSLTTVALDRTTRSLPGGQILDSIFSQTSQGTVDISIQVTSFAVYNGAIESTTSSYQSNISQNSSASKPSYTGPVTTSESYSSSEAVEETYWLAPDFNLSSSESISKSQPDSSQLVSGKIDNARSVVGRNSLLYWDISLSPPQRKLRLGDGSEKSAIANLPDVSRSNLINGSIYVSPLQADLRKKKVEITTLSVTEQADPKIKEVDIVPLPKSFEAAVLRGLSYHP